MTRALVFSVVGIALLVLLGPLQRLIGLDIIAVDVPLITVLYMAVAGRGVGPARQTHAHRNLLTSGGIDWTGGVTGFVLGYVADVLSGGLKGAHCLTATVMFLVTLWAARHVYLAGTLSVLVVSFAASVLASLVTVTIRWATGVSPSLSTLTVIASQAVLCAVAAPLLMRLFRLIDAKLSHDGAERGTLCQ